MRPVSQIQRDRRNVISMLPAAQPRRRVLIADADPTTQSSILVLAQAERCEIVWAKDGAQAYRQLKSDADFQSVVIDPRLPGMDAFELLRYMKSENRLRRIPIVLVVADSGVELIARGFSAGALACLWKPYAPDVLWRTLRMVLPLAVAKRKAA
jgi:CheY-like chemotaxis protein